MIKRDWRDHGCRRGIKHIGCVHPTTQSGFKDQHIGGNARKGKKCRSLRNFKEGNGIAVINGFDFFEQVTKRLFGNLRTGNDNTFVKTHKMRGCRAMNPKACGLINRAQISLGGPLAVGAGQMNDRRQTQVRITKLFKKPGNPPE